MRRTCNLSGFHLGAMCREIVPFLTECPWMIVRLLRQKFTSNERTRALCDSQQLHHRQRRQASYRYRVRCNGGILQHLRIVKIYDHRPLADLRASRDEYVPFTQVFMKDALFVYLPVRYKIHETTNLKCHRTHPSLYLA